MGWNINNIFKRKNISYILFSTPRKFNHCLFSLPINFFLCQYHRQQTRERDHFRRVTIVLRLSMTYFRPYWFSFPHHIEGRICERILRIFWTCLTDNESVSILLTNWVWIECGKGSFQIKKKVACWGRVQ